MIGIYPQAHLPIRCKLLARRLFALVKDRDAVAPVIWRNGLAKARRFNSRNRLNSSQQHFVKPPALLRGVPLYAEVNRREHEIPVIKSLVDGPDLLH